MEKIANFKFMWPCLLKSSQIKYERDAAELMFISVHFLNMFQASLCPSSGVQDWMITAYGVLHWLCGRGLDELRWNLCALYGYGYASRLSSSRPRLQNQCRTPYAVTIQSCTPEDGHNDAWNMLRKWTPININSASSRWFFSLTWENYSLVFFDIEFFYIGDRRFWT
jgi:hypothetical protein